MTPEKIPETVSAIAQLGPWGLVVLVVVCVLIGAGALGFVVWRVLSAATGKLVEVLKEHVLELREIRGKFADHALADQRLHDDTRAEIREEVAKVKADVAGMLIGLAQDLERAEIDIKTHVATEIKLARAGTSSAFNPAVRPVGRGSRPGG